MGVNNSNNNNTATFSNFRLSGGMQTGCNVPKGKVGQPMAKLKVMVMMSKGVMIFWNIRNWRPWLIFTLTRRMGSFAPSGSLHNVGHGNERTNQPVQWQFKHKQGRKSYRTYEKRPHLWLYYMQLFLLLCERAIPFAPVFKGSRQKQ